MNESQLQSAWLMVKELRNQEQYIKGKETKTVNERIAINEMQTNYGCMK